MREIVHLQAGQCGNQIGAKVGTEFSNQSWKIFQWKSKKIQMENQLNYSKFSLKKNEKFFLNHQYLNDFH
jgi:hypothetical protein